MEKHTVRPPTREQAEAAWSPTSPYSVDELEQRIRAKRGYESRA